VFRINGQLVVAVPKQNRPSSVQIKRAPAQCRQFIHLPSVPFLEFVIWGSWSGTYRPEDVPGVDGMDAKHVRPDLLWVRIEPLRRTDLSPEAVTRRLEERGREADLRGEKKREVGGLTCRGFGPNMPPYLCLEKSDSASDLVKLQYRQANQAFVQIFADYTTSQFGGIHIYWKVVTSDVARWKDIDREIRGRLAEWNLVAGASGTAAVSATP
jgi:hypothetical protein